MTTVSILNSEMSQITFLSTFGHPLEWNKYSHEFSVRRGAFDDRGDT